jgi:hypothetical protein
MMKSKEYRALVRRLLKENNLRCTGTWTDYPDGMCATGSGRTGDRIITHRIYGDMDNFELFTEELFTYVALCTGTYPRWTSAGYLKYNTKISHNFLAE